MGGKSSVDCRDSTIARSGVQVDDRRAMSIAPPGQEVSTMTAIVTWGTELTILDRCDRCGADARVRVVFLSGADLLFCGHHGRRFEKKFSEVATVVEWSA
jgi:hypothetical protein